MSDHFPVIIRHVWAHNLVSEFKLIQSCVSKFPIISMDTEFPGVVLIPHSFTQPPAPILRNFSGDENYFFLKSNVDLLHIIQIGLTLSDDAGTLPDLGTGKYHYIWEFNFRDFDIEKQTYARDSIQLLIRQGINFAKNRKFGVDSAVFAELMMTSGLVCNDSVSWVTFHGCYDFGYLVKILTQSKLPFDLSEFSSVMRSFFGARVYDVKHMMKFCEGLSGGLDKLAKKLGINRTVGRSHQAGSDSLLTLQVFLRLRKGYFEGEAMEKFACLLFGYSITLSPIGIGSLLLLDT